MATEPTATRWQELLGDSLVGVDPLEGTEGRLRFRPADAEKVFRAVHEAGYHHLTMLGGIDWVDHREVFYTLWSDARKSFLFLSTDLPADQPHLPTATGVWPSANWHEREAWEMVDIHFDGHPDLRHLLMPDGYQFHPLLRSFKLHEPEELEVKVRHV
jgi:NADH-quinone oxidoreductase subunit C